MAEVVVTLVNVPQLDPEQPVPDADHVTPAPRASFSTVAVTGSVSVMVRPPRLGDMLTLRVAEVPVTVMVAEALLVVFETEVAVSLTVAGFGIFGGAK